MLLAVTVTLALPTVMVDPGQRVRVNGKKFIPEEKVSIHPTYFGAGLKEVLK